MVKLLDGNDQITPLTSRRYHIGIFGSRLERQQRFSQSDSGVHSRFCQIGLGDPSEVEAIVDDDKYISADSQIAGILQIPLDIIAFVPNKS